MRLWAWIGLALAVSVVTLMGLAAYVSAARPEPARVPRWVYDEDEEPWRVLPLPD